jgi:hypothetical protein
MPKSVGAMGDLERGATSRRGFMTGAGLGALSLFGIPALATPAAALAADFREKELTATDIDVLNFALNIEYLGAEFYLRAVFGRGLNNADVTGTGNLGDVNGGTTPVPFQTIMAESFAREIAMNEEAHVRFIRATLGSNAVARPPIDLVQGFTLAARLAGLIGPTATFNPLANEASFWVAAMMLEDVDVTAYRGGARLLTDRTVLDAAAGILATEAYQAGEIRTLLFQRGQFAESRAVSNLRDAADGPEDLDQPIRIPGGGGANIVPTDANGITFARTPQQVLNIVYLGGAPANFGFFPERVNGAIR